jgi:hypothetical protein
MSTRYHVSRTIDAPPDKVWALLTDASSYRRWNPSVISIEGVIETGSRISLVSVANPKRTFKLTVAAMESPSAMVWSDGMPLGLFKGERTFRLDGGEGRTVFSMTEEYSGLLAGLISKAIPDLTESFEAFADGLKRGAEANSG